MKTQTAAVESLPHGFEAEAVAFRPLQRSQKSRSPLLSSRNPTLGSSGAREQRSNGVVGSEKLNSKTLKKTNKMHCPDFGIVLDKSEKEDFKRFLQCLSRILKNIGFLFLFSIFEKEPGMMGYTLRLASGGNGGSRN